MGDFSGNMELNLYFMFLFSLCPNYSQYPLCKWKVFFYRWSLISVKSDLCLVNFCTNLTFYLAGLPNSTHPKSPASKIVPDIISVLLQTLGPLPREKNVSLFSITIETIRYVIMFEERPVVEREFWHEKPNPVIYDRIDTSGWGNSSNTQTTPQKEKSSR